MNTEKLTYPVVKKAIDALQAGDKFSWLALFTDQAEFSDDGNKIDLRQWSEEVMGHERFISIDNVEDQALSVYGNFQSDQWGIFKTYFKFHVDASGRIERLEIGQAGD